MLNVGKIDRNEESIPMAADIRKQDEAENKKAEQSKYNKAWNDAIEENKEEMQQELLVGKVLELMLYR